LARSVALIAPSYCGDFERFSLLCDNIDRRVVGYERHYVIVSDDDMPLFQAFSSGRRIVLPSSRLLPRWLRLTPRARLRNGRKIWWSFRARPVHGRHVQQILKIAAAVEMPVQRFCLIDSDNVFVRPFDVGAYAGGERSIGRALDASATQNGAVDPFQNASKKRRHLSKKHAKAERHGARRFYGAFTSVSSTFV